MWSVVMVRPLVDDSAGSVPLAPGETVSAAFAVWDGSQRDRDGQKLITIWQDLAIQAR
jgi:complex iron-sulfur molybdoenzyme family reductase subunit gamma